MIVGDATRALTAPARFHDYRTASNPLAGGLIGAIPLVEFPAELHASGPTRIVALDNATALRCPGPATSPGLLASFLRIEAGGSLATDVDATSQLFFVIRGAGRSRLAADGLEIPWQAGDLFTAPARSALEHHATADAALYQVHDGPLLRYLGVTAGERRFTPTLYQRAAMTSALEAIVADPASARANRLSVLLGNEAFPQTLTVTHVIWAMFGRLPVGALQAPHRHQSVALDLVVDARPGCYTLVGASLGPDGRIRDPQRVEWRPGSAFVTPPGLWHSHHNESGHPAHILPIQDAGLHTFLRTLNILFSRTTPSGGCEVVETAG